MTPLALAALVCLAEGAAPPDARKGVVVVAALDPKDAKALALKGGLSWKELHCTVAFLGDLEELGAETLQKVKKALVDWSAGRAPIPALVGGVGRFPGSKEDGDPVYLPVDAPRLTIERPSLLHALRDAGAPARTDHGFNAHITLSYVPRDEDLPTQRVKPRQIRFRAIELWVGKKHFRYTLDADYDTPEPSLRDAPKMETAMHTQTLATLSRLAESRSPLLQEEHEGEKMVFGQWRKIPATPHEHAQAATDHTTASRAHFKTGSMIARKAALAFNDWHHKKDASKKDEWLAHQKKAADHFALSHAHGEMAKGHTGIVTAAKEAGLKPHDPVAPNMRKLSTAHPKLQVTTHTDRAGRIQPDGSVHSFTTPREAADHPVHAKEGLGVAKAVVHTAASTYHRGEDPAHNDKHHAYFDHTDAAPENLEGRFLPTNTMVEMIGVAASTPQAIGEDAGFRKAILRVGAEHGEGGEPKDHPGEKMVFGVWRKVGTKLTPEEHTDQAKRHHALATKHSGIAQGIMANKGHSFDAKVHSKAAEGHRRVASWHTNAAKGTGYAGDHPMHGGAFFMAGGDRTRDLGEK